MVIGVIGIVKVGQPLVHLSLINFISGILYCSIGIPLINESVSRSALGLWTDSTKNWDPYLLRFFLFFFSLVHVPVFAVSFHGTRHTILMILSILLE